jgi:hypothetical protein
LCCGRAARGIAAALVAASVLGSPGIAEGYRRGLASSVGGASLGRGHVAWIGLGYPRAALGWGVAVHQRVDLLLEAEAAFGHPAQSDRLIWGGGGGLTLRVGVLRGRTSLALSARAAATVYAEGGGVAVLLDLLSPGVELSLRLSPIVALHASLRVPLHYLTQPPSFGGGYEARCGVSVVVWRDLAVFTVIGAGATLWSVHGAGSPRVEAVAGIEYRILP